MRPSVPPPTGRTAMLIISGPVVRCDDREVLTWSAQLAMTISNLDDATAAQDRFDTIVADGTKHRADGLIRPTADNSAAKGTIESHFRLTDVDRVWPGRGVVKSRPIRSGKFTYPYCGGETYTTVENRRWVSFAGAPIIRLGVEGVFDTCDSCDRVVEF